MTKKPKRSKSLSDVPMGNTPMAIGPDKAAERRYRAEDALRTITRAEEHKGDPRLMSDVKKLARDMAAKLKKVAAK